jgi:ESCRT-II complex subunit VPS22
MESRRRPVGIAALQKAASQRAAQSTHGLSLQASHVDSLQTQLSVFRASLSAFARQHAKDIRSNPSFRAEFGRMCSAIGVDPLLSSSGKKGNFWAELLGESVGGFYFELAVRVVEVCRATRGENGGLLSVKECRARIQSPDESGGSVEISEDDILRAVKSLKPLGSGFDITTIGGSGGRKYIRSVPKELSDDQAKVLDALQVMGFVTVDMLIASLGWEGARAKTVCVDLLSESLVWVDHQSEEVEYWTPEAIFGKEEDA